MRDKKLLILVVLTVMFGIAVIVWYFFRAQSANNPTINTPSNPFGDIATNIPGREFITSLFNGGRDEDTEQERILPGERILAQIWDKPVAGYAFISREVILEATSTNATSTSKKTTLIKKQVDYLLFVDRLTGHVYGYEPKEGLLFQITNTTVPGIYDAYIVRNGTQVFMRRLDTDGETIITTVATIPPFIAGSEPKPLLSLGSLQRNVSSFAVSESSNTYSYLVANTTGSSVYTVNDKNKVSVTTSPFREWGLTYGGEVPYMTTRPSAYIPGHTMTALTQSYVFGDKTGLLSLPNSDNETFLASMWSSRGLTTFLVSKKDGTPRILDIDTLAPKCVWLGTFKALCGVPTELPESEEGLPDDWFQGTVSFSDDFYLIIRKGAIGENDITSLLYPLSEQSGKPFDVTKPSANKSGSLVGFTNKQDGTLWLFNVALASR